MSALLSIVLSAFSVFAPTGQSFYGMNTDATVGVGSDITTVHTSSFYGMNTD